MDQKSSLNVQLFRRVVLLSLIAILVLMAGVFVSLFSRLYIIQLQLENTGLQAAQSFDSFLEMTTLDLLATSDTLAISDDAGAVFRHALNRQQDLEGPIFKFTLLDPQGKVLAQRSRAGGQVDTELSDQPWLARVEAGEVYISPVSFEEFGLPFIDMAVPVNDEIGHFVSTLVAEVDLTTLWDLVRALEVGETGYGYITDTDGQLLVHKELRLLESRETLEERINLSPQEIAAADRLYIGLENDLVLAVGVPLENEVGWFTIIEQPVGDMLHGFVLLMALVLVVLSAVVALFYNFMRFTRNRVMTPLHVFRESVDVIGQGDLEHRVDIQTSDEFGMMAGAFNTMADDFQSLVINLEQRVMERTRNLEVVSELGRLVTGQRGLDILLPYAVDIIKRRTGFYHVQIFLVDEYGEYAHLRASTGEAGKTLLAGGHRLEVGSESVIGRVTESGQPLIALDTEDAMVVHRPNPLLPDTRSEMALPLRVAASTIGALDVQSLAPKAFDESDVELFQTLADQLANAIDNAKHLQTLDERLREIEHLNRVLMGEAYSEVVRLRRANTIGYTSHGSGVVEDQEWTKPLVRALDEGVVVESTEGEERQHLSLPITTRGGARVGAFEFEIDSKEWRDDLPDLANALLERVTASLETARVFEQAQRLALREQQVNLVNIRLQEEGDIEDLLVVAADEIRRALNARRTAIRVDLQQT